MKNLIFKILLLVIPNVVLGQSKTVFPKVSNKFIIVAHRGFHVDVPENTIESLRKAIEIGVDYVEVDIRTTLEGVPVVMHDANLERTTDGKGKVSAISTSDFRKLKIKGTEISPPTFSSFLMEAKGKVNLYLDIKEADPEKIVALLDKYQMRERVVIYCSPQQIFQWKKLAPTIPIITTPLSNVKTSFEFEAFILSFSASVLDGNIKTYSPEISQKLAEINIPIWLDTLGDDDNAQGWETAIGLNINALQTDKPKELIGYLSKRNLR
ncbi:MAG: glycerophosphodiester phosphodiesterase family protein [Emticicia sp.]